MMRKFSLLACVCAMIMSGAALAKEKAPKPAKREKVVKICRTTQKTGSRMGAGRVCKTAAEWEGTSDQNGLGQGLSGQSYSGAGNGPGGSPQGNRVKV
jgi:hypothetical protein